MNVIKEWQINTAGNSKGLAIPSGFRVLVVQSNIIANNNGEVASHRLECEICTFSDGNYTEILYNDDLNSLDHISGNQGVYDNPSLSSGIKTVTKTAIEADLDGLYGDANVQEIT